jgi:cytochrome c
MRHFPTFAQWLVGSALLIVVLTTATFGEGSHQGKELFQTRCGGCHSLDADKVGPRLRGVFGRAVGSVQTFSYSDAAKASHVTWNEETLDKWLAEPDSVIPDNDMSFRLDNARERAAIIEYLKHLDPK